jgi:hypothetical protein
MKTPDDMTASQRALMQKLFDADGFVFLTGAEKRVAWNLGAYDLVFIGMRRSDEPKGDPVKLTREGRAWWGSFLNPWARGH